MIQTIVPVNNVAATWAKSNSQRFEIVSFARLQL